jgi:hypothetical protein
VPERWGALLSLLGATTSLYLQSRHAEVSRLAVRHICIMLAAIHEQHLRTVVRGFSAHSASRLLPERLFGLPRHGLAGSSLERC